MASHPVSSDLSAFLTAAGAKLDIARSARSGHHRPGSSPALALTQLLPQGRSALKRPLITDR
jgi:hypothetical protein